MKRLRAEEKALERQIEEAKLSLRQESKQTARRPAHRTPASPALTKSAIAMQYRWVSAIRAKILDHWTHPKGYQPGQSCRVIIKQDRQGFIRSMHIEQCSGSARVKRSVATAITHAEPFPRAPNPQVYQSTLYFSFSY